MDIIISNTGGQPIYEQICRQIKGAIAAGKLKPGEPLPSIRALARDLRISVITTKRAYEELERDGFICTQAGKGSFVAAQELTVCQGGWRKFSAGEEVPKEGRKTVGFLACFS